MAVETVPYGVMNVKVFSCILGVSSICNYKKLTSFVKE